MQLKLKNVLENRLTCFAKGDRTIACRTGSAGAVKGFLNRGRRFGVAYRKGELGRSGAFISASKIASGGVGRRLGMPDRDAVFPFIAFESIASRGAMIKEYPLLVRLT